MKATEQYFPVVQFIILYKVVLLRLWMKSYAVWCDHSKSYDKHTWF